MTTRYEVHVEGASEEFTAENLEAAIEHAREWLTEGDWEPIESTIWVHGLLYEIDDDSEETTNHRVTATIDPPEPKCAPLKDQEHDWRSPYDIVGGCKESPGVYGHGGGVTIQEVCMVCGCGRLIDTWAQDPETGEQGLESVSYQPGKYTRELAPKFEIQTRRGDGPWENDTVGDPNEFDSEEEAEAMIEELKQLEDDTWREGEYRVVEITRA